MPKKCPPEFNRDVVTVARRRDLTVPDVAVEFAVSEESVRRWTKQAHVDDGIVDGQTSSGQSELAQLRRRLRRLQMENEVLRRAAAYFALSPRPGTQHDQLQRLHRADLRGRFVERLR